MGFEEREGGCHSLVQQVMNHFGRHTGVLLGGGGVLSDVGGQLIFGENTEQLLPIERVSRDLE